MAPEWGESEGGLAEELASRYGLTPDPWQAAVLNDWLAVRPDSKFSASRCGLSVPRQNGKNAVIEMRELFGLVMIGERILHSAHEVKTARKAFLRLLGFFENRSKYPELADLVAPSGVRKTNGQEAIRLTNGGSIEFVARSKGSARGFTVDVIVADEAQQLSDVELESFAPATSAAPLQNRQLIFTGTPPTPQTNSEVWRRLRGEAQSGGSERLCWHEWSVERGADLDDPLSWARANPALGIRLGVEEVREDRGFYSDEGFARERLGVWDAVSSSAVIQADWWQELVTADAADDGGDVAVAVDVSPARNSGSITVAGRLVDGTPFVDVVENRNGSPEWIVPMVARICEAQPVRAVVVDRAGPAANLIDQLSRARVSSTTTDENYMRQACADFFDAVISGRLAHLDQPVLNLAVSHGRRRKINDGWAWNRSSADADITPLVSATLALWGLQHSRVQKAHRPVKPRRRVVVA